MALLLMVGSVQQMDAQKRQTTKRRTNTTRRTVTPQQTAPTEKFVREIAFYDVKALDFCVEGQYLFYVEKMPNNAVMRIDRTTGEVTTVLPGIANVYEGRRAVITSIDVAANRFIFGYGDYPGSVGIIEDTQFKFKGSKDWERVIRTKGDYMLVMRHDSGTELYDVKNMKPVNLQGIPDSGNSSIELSPNGDVWFPGRDGNNFGVIRLSKDGKRTFFNLSNQAYIMSEGIKPVDWYNNPITWFTSAGQYLYMSCKRRVYRLDMLQPAAWEEYGKIPATLDSNFAQFWPNFRGDILNNDKGSRKTYWFYRADARETPQCLADWNYIPTGLSKFGWEQLWPSLSKVRVDFDNNYVIAKEDGIRIYNPNGVVGYEKARGKVYKP